MALVLTATGGRAAVAADWWTAMAPPAQVVSGMTGADKLDTLARQAAALQTLQDVVDTLADTAPGGAWLNRDQQTVRRAYSEALSAAIGAATDITDPGWKTPGHRNPPANAPRWQWNEQREKYARDPAFVTDVVTRYGTPEARDRYLATRNARLAENQKAAEAQADKEWALHNTGPRPKPPTPEEAKAAAGKAAAVAHLKGKLNAELGAGVDRKVFGIELGEKLSLPPCKEGVTGTDVVAGLAGVGRGGSRTCVGDVAATLAVAMIEVGTATAGLTGPKSTVAQVPTRLADSMCPAWVRLGGTCNVMLSVHEGLVLGATLVPGTGRDNYTAVMQQLTKKYGKPSREGELIQCANNLTGVVTDEARPVYWILPGLQVTYSPLISDCLRGRVVVELDYLKKLRAHETAAHEAQQPQM
jgi:hypothetical protein